MNVFAYSRDAAARDADASDSLRVVTAPGGRRRPSWPKTHRAGGGDRLAIAAIRPKEHRVAVLDSDAGFVVVLAKRLEQVEWKHHLLTPGISMERVAALGLSALVVDLAEFGPRAWEWLVEVRAALPDIAIVVCTGSSTVAQRVRGLQLGADDWLTKPCHPAEVVARVESVIGRRLRETASAREPILLGELTIRPDRFQAYVRGRSLKLTRREFELLELFASAQGRVLEREEICSSVWGYAMMRGDRTVDVFVAKLRTKLSRSSPEWRYIHTHYAVGYRCAAEELLLDEDEDDSVTMAAAS